jgi:hypothetical protein
MIRAIRSRPFPGHQMRRPSAPASIGSATRCNPHLGLGCTFTDRQPAPRRGDRPLRAGPTTEAGRYCERAIIIGYSRGADLVPFMVARLPAGLRKRLDVVALMGLSKVASLQYQPTDLFADALRFNDHPGLPELQRLRGLRLLCLSGERERGSLCPELDPDLARVTTHAGGHVVSRETARAVEQAIVTAVAPPAITSPRPPGARR